MFMVQCKEDRRGARWCNYSGVYQTRQKAEECKERAEAQHVLSVNLRDIVYRVVSL